ncbi:MAG TPA: hypothetical protein DCX25_01720 [Candidatus Pacebacteria bacterium]|nr:MAG: hypothetical protein UX00_C0002G0010 [Microgenomates group bacterium GW2011_GWB1_45_17]KKU23086.1 MAG: hypothetical protein UX35_C0010G0004 [Microgenomates group bacterium GW2011_GWA1_46_15]KKU23749.1 MAG: hypothetical protein UX36_C0003G0049 [Microgenomates group bacterium GW2011_GWC1_46_15]HAV15023.1 hypothetical protein [Candidatus Paceibacterota bacterium]HCR11720.1 hypothetical protein [Candidatus Paceibacterota bacterium]
MKKRMAKKHPAIVLYDLIPLNIEEEKRKFLFDPQYNPQFRYERVMNETEAQKYGKISNEYLPQATHILDTVMKKWGNEQEFLEEVKGRELTREEVVRICDAYFKENHVDGKVKLQFTNNALSPTSMKQSTLTIRLPIMHREKQMTGTLYHEIGTHFFRSLNEAKQPWFGKRNEYHLHEYSETEEGLAVFHANLEMDHPYLWNTALQYYAVSRAAELSFSALFNDLKKYVESKERRWSICLRVKRGVTDTSIPGAIAKDQVYFRGAMSMAKWMKQHEYDPRRLYIGKIATQDLEKAWNMNPTYEPLLPAFLHGDLTAYKDRIKHIIAVNMLEKV